eukprot:1155312-Pelagomonas_calceolata.AAC.1
MSAEVQDPLLSASLPSERTCMAYLCLEVHVPAGAHSNVVAVNLLKAEAPPPRMWCEVGVAWAM